MKKVIFLAMAVAAVQFANAQSIFSGLGKPVANPAKQESTLMFSSKAVADSVVFTTDSTVIYSATPQNVFRIVTNIGTYGIVSNGYRIMAGVGIGYVHYKLNAKTGDWDNQWGVAILQYAGGNISPTSPTQVAATGVTFSYGLMSVGLAKDGPVWKFDKSNPVYLTVGANFPLFANKK